MHRPTRAKDLTYSSRALLQAVRDQLKFLLLDREFAQRVGKDAKKLKGKDKRDEGDSSTQLCTHDASALLVDYMGNELEIAFHKCGQVFKRGDWTGYLHAIAKSVGKPMCFGSPEMKDMKDAGRDDGINGLTAVQQLWRELRPQGDYNKTFFSFAMDLLVPMMLMGIRHDHKALADCRHEAVVLTALAQAVLEHYEATGQLDEL